MGLPHLRFDIQIRPRNEVVSAQESIGSTAGMSPDDFQEKIKVALADIRLKLSEATSAPQEDLTETGMNEAFMRHVRQLLHSLFCICADSECEGVSVAIASDSKTGNVVGFIQGIIQGDEVAMIDYLVREDQQKLGIATALHLHFVEQMRGKGVRRLINDVMDLDNTAGVGLLRKVGYQQPDSEEQYFYLDILKFESQEIPEALVRAALAKINNGLAALSQKSEDYELDEYQQALQAGIDILGIQLKAKPKAISDVDDLVEAIAEDEMSEMRGFINGLLYKNFEEGETTGNRRLFIYKANIPESGEQIAMVGGVIDGGKLVSMDYYVVAGMEGVRNTLFKAVFDELRVKGYRTS